MENSLKTSRWSKTENSTENRVRLDILLFHYVESQNVKPDPDMSPQYSGTMYQTILKTYDMIASMSRKGNCYDNAVAESFFSNLKNELVYHCYYHDHDEARAAIFKYIEVFYNRKRLHETLNYISPEQYELLTNAA